MVTKKKRRSQTKRCANKKITVDDDLQLVLLDEIFLEYILTKLAVQPLKNLSFVSKLWYNSIYKDPRFPSSHFQQSKKNPFLIFHLLNYSYKDFISIKHVIFSIDLDGNNGGHYDYYTLANNVDTDNNLVFHRNASFGTLKKFGLVNYCNGFGCYTPSCSIHVNFVIQNPSWGLEILSTSCPNPNLYIKSYYGFGFDSLTNEYKVVAVLFNSKHGAVREELFKGVVYTLGTCSWRKTDSSPLVAGGASSGIGMSFSRCAIFVGGFLFWRIFTRGVDDGDKTREMLLLFDLHDENFQFVHIPAECASTTTAERMQVVDHLIVIKGSPCVVVFEKLLLSNGHHVNHPQKQSNSPLCCCCCCKIHLFVLKDIIKQVWIKETIDVCTSSWLSPAKFCCCCLDAGTASPPTRILSAFDRVLLYWFDGSCLRLFDPLKNILKVVKCSHDDRKFFEHKMNGYHIQDVGNHADTGNANIYFQDADVQLIADSKNFTTLRAFIPEGAKKNRPFGYTKIEIHRLRRGNRGIRLFCICVLRRL